MRTTTTSPTDAPTGTDHTVSRDGTTIGWQRTGDGPPVVLLHGTSSERSGWALSTPHLADRFTLLAVDRRGRGLSSDGAPYAFERELEDLAAVVGTLDAAPHVVGHSFGAVVAAAAVAQGLRVRSLTLYEPPLAAAEQMDVVAIARACDAAIAAGDRDGCLAAFYGAIGELDRLAMMRRVPPVHERFLRDAHTIAREVRASAGFSLAMAAGVEVPTHLLVGSASPALFRDTVTRLATVLPGAEVSVLEGQAHLAQAFAPEAFATAVADFLERH